MKLPQKKDTPPSSEGPEAPPQEKTFKFERRTGPRPQDVEDIEVPESELSHDQVALLAQDLWRLFTYMPDIVQDQFLARVQTETAIAYKQALEAVSNIVDVDGVPLSILKGEA